MLAFLRQFENETLLVVANLSRFAQCCELDLASRQGTVPVEVFGRAKFPTITENPYLLSLGPHAFYWFHLQPRETSQETLNVSSTPQELPVLQVESVEEAFSEDVLAKLYPLVPALLRGRPWFLGKHRYITGLSLQNALALPDTSSHLLLLNVEYGEGDPETYFVPLSMAEGEKADAILRDHPEVVLARVEVAGADSKAVLYGATFDREFSDGLLRAIVRRRRIKGNGGGELIGSHTRLFRNAWTTAKSNLEPSPQQSDQSFTILNYGSDFVMKLYREIEDGINPGREVPEFLCEQTQFHAVPAALGSLEYRRYFNELPVDTCLGTLSSAVPGSTVGWQLYRRPPRHFLRAHAGHPAGRPTRARPDSAQSVVIARSGPANHWRVAGQLPRWHSHPGPAHLGDAHGSQQPARCR